MAVAPPAAAPVELDAPPLGDEAAADLLAAGIRALEDGQADTARRAFAELEGAGKLADWAAFHTGLLERGLGDEAAAERAFSAAVARSPTLFWAHYERLRLPTVQRDRARRDRYAEALLDIAWEPLERLHIAQVEQVARAVWRDGRHDLAGRLLARLWPSEALSVTAVARIVETALDPALIDAATQRLAALPGRRPDAYGGGDEQDAFDAAVQDFQAGRLAAAAEIFERLTASPTLSGWSHFHLGRIYVGEADQSRSLRAFDAAVAAEPGLFWAHHERLVLASSLDVAASTVAAHLRDMAALDWPTLAPIHVRDLEAAAHRLWARSEEEAAAILLSRLWPSEEIGALGLTRIVERSPHPDIRHAAADRLRARGELDETALRILADFHVQLGQTERGVAALEWTAGVNPHDFHTWLALVRSYAKAGERDRAVAMIGEDGGFSAKQRLFATLLVHLDLEEVNDAFLAFRDHCRRYDDIAKFPGIRVAYLLSDAHDVARRDEVVGILRCCFPDDRDIQLVLINIAMRDQRWEVARALFDAHFGGMADMPQNVRLARVDILAFTGRLAEAADLIERERENGLLPVPFLRAALRILAELGRWEDAFESALRQLSDDVSFRQFLAPTIRAARRTGGSARLLDGLLALPEPLGEEQRDAAFAVAEDLAEQGRADVLERIAALDPPFERRRRIELKLGGRAAPAATERDLCIYYCADRDYLMPALVSLTALAMTNASVARRAAFSLVVEADVLPAASAAGQAIAERLGIALTVVDAAGIVPSTGGLRTDYGLFTGGQSLSLAAYYRIFFARRLAADGRFRQALYIDSDTIVRGGLDELFALAPSAPLLARSEIDRPEVRHATELHRLTGRYFNSGVLHLDLSHPRLPELLDRAIAAATDPAVPLVFQDQCALNIAFDGQVAELPARFNHFNPPSVSGDDIAAGDAVIVHYLDRPKPWDGLYRQRAREWFEWYDLVRTLCAGPHDLA